MSEKKKELISKSTEVAGALVDKLSGILPAVAEAKAEAEEITLRGMIKNEGIAHRAGYRIVRHQGNLEDIAHLAGERMPPDSAQKARDLNVDWADDVAEKCKTVSDKEMQSLWAKILVSETVESGSFSKSTVDAVSKMSKDDALLFSDFCQFVWNMGSDSGEGVPLIYASEDEVYQGQRPMFEVAKHLDYLRLISFDGIGYSKIYRAPAQGVQPIVWLFYQGALASLDLPLQQGGKKDMHYMNIGLARFTEAGQQLCRICEPPKNKAFFRYTLKKWRELGYNPSLMPGVKE